jgi:hypothetical protein
MSNKLFFTAIIYGISIASLCAQASSALPSNALGQTALPGIVDSLTYYALFVLLGVIVLAGLLYIVFVWKHCVNFQQTQTKAPKVFLHLLMWSAGLCTLGSSCTTAQQAQAADILAKQAAENRTCPMNHHYEERANTIIYNSSLYSQYSSWHSSSFCRFCGQRIFRTSN